MKQYIVTGVLFSFSIPAFALDDVYFHLGGGFDVLSHSKSTRKYPMLDLKAGLGYKIVPDVSVEFDAQAISTTSFTSEGTCTTTVGGTVPCSQKDTVERYSFTFSPVYSTELLGVLAYAKLGLSLIASDFLSKRESAQASSVTLLDESSYNAAAVLNVGIVTSRTHRFGLFASTTYGNAEIGNFNYLGFDYNYLFNY